MLQIIARIISVVFHPLAVIMAFAMVYITTIYDNEMALLVMSLFGYIAVLPIVIYNSVQLLRGKISNFDLSNQHERNKSYPLLLLILILLVVSAIYTSYSSRFKFRNFRIDVGRVLLLQKFFENFVACINFFFSHCINHI
jgi:hypothetical protein